MSISFLRIFLKLPSANSLALEVHLDPVVRKKQQKTDKNRKYAASVYTFKNVCFSFHFLNK